MCDTVSKEVALQQLRDCTGCTSRHLHRCVTVTPADEALARALQESEVERAGAFPSHPPPHQPAGLRSPGGASSTLSSPGSSRSPSPTLLHWGPGSPTCPSPSAPPLAEPAGVRSWGPQGTTSRRPPDTSGDAAIAASLQRELERETAEGGLIVEPGPVGTMGLADASASRQGLRWQNGFGDRCMACQGRLGCFGGRGSAVSALGGVWHHDCFTCGLCCKPIGRITFRVGPDGCAYHPDCCKRKFVPRCSVCHHHFPVQVGAQPLLSVYGF